MYQLVRIEVGEFEVLDSGCVTSIGNRDVLFTIKGDVQVHVHFENDEGHEQSFNSSINGNTLTINFINFNNPLGTEITNPLEIGTVDGRRLFCHFRVTGMNTIGNRVIFYSWLLGNNVNNG